jgi:uncharacterized protein (DUF58 family)
MSIPTLEELLALRGAAHDLTLKGRGPARASLLGVHCSAQRGRGLEFQEVRPYVAGDDPRNIDWRVTARRGRPHTKLFHEERERPVWLLVDLQPGLFFGSRHQLKSAVALRAAALLAWTAALGGDRVGGVVGAAPEQRRILPARARLAGVLPLIEALLAAQPVAPAQPAPGTLEAVLHASAPLIRPGSLVLAVSDFAAVSERHENLWAGLAAHSDIRLFWVTDPLEAKGLPDGRFRAGLPNRLSLLDGARTRARWLKAWGEREARLMRLAQRCAAPVARLDTSESVQSVLRPMLLRGPSAA